MEYKKISNKYWIHNNPETLLDNQPEWEQVKGRKVTIKELEGYDLFYHKDRYSDYVISEGKTGMRMSHDFTLKEAIDWLLIKYFNMKNGRTYQKPVRTHAEVLKLLEEGIEKGIEIGGISPRYKPIMEIV